MNILEIKNVSKAFGDDIANDDISFDVQDGEFFILLGPSGCGKSTLLRTVAGLEEPDRGEIYLNGNMILDQEPSERDVAMMFQRPTLYPHLNVYDNVAFPLRIQGTDKSILEEKVTEALELVQIPEKRDANVGSLSGGQAQRAIMARVLVQDPALLLLDEPFTALDHQLRIYMRNEILRIHRETNVTIMFVTHNQEEAMKLGDRLAIMRRGGIDQLGTPKEILKEPKNKFVAEFIGHPQINFIQATTHEKNGKMFFEMNSETYGPVNKENLSEQVNKDEVILGIRPEQVHVEGGNSPGKNRFVSEVEIVEDMGTNSYIYFPLGESTIQADVSRQGEWSRGEEVTFWFDDERLKIFSSDGDRIR